MREGRFFSWTRHIVSAYSDQYIDTPFRFQTSILAKIEITVSQNFAVLELPFMSLKFNKTRNLSYQNWQDLYFAKDSLY